MSIWSDGLTWDEAQLYMASALPGPGTASAAAIEGIRWGVDPNHRARRGRQADALGESIYNITGYDPFGTQDPYDLTGAGAQRKIATKLTPASQAQYQAMQDAYQKQFAEARQSQLRNLQSSGLMKSGMQASQQSESFDAQAAKEAEAFAALLMREQEFYNQQYGQERQLLAQSELMKMQMAEARKRATNEAILELFGFATDIVTSGVGGSGSVPTAGASAGMAG